MNTPVVEALAALDPEGRCVVALGGGADSAVLLAGAVEAFGSDRVVGVFVNHGLEGSAGLMVTVEQLCGELGVPLHVELAKVVDGSDLEARARDARYRALQSVLGPSDICCTGHTRDDVAETVLMRLLRGAGPTGLDGIPAVRGQFRRPLLGFARAWLREVATHAGLPFTDDPANTDMRFLRSRVRNELIPMLEADYGDRLRDNLVASAELVRADRESLDAIADGIPIRVTEREIGLPAAVLSTQPRAVATRLVRRGLSHIHDPYMGARSDVDAVLATLGDGTPRVLTGDIDCVRDPTEVVLVLREPVSSIDPIAVGPGESFVWDGEPFRVATTHSAALATTTPRRTAIAIDDDRIVIRGVADGDRIDIDGGTTPVSEVLRSAGVPPRNRAIWMLITVDDRIAAVHGIRVAPWARPTPGQQAVIIEWEDHR